MREERPSLTAGFVAAFRTLGATLAPEARIAHDPYGARFLGRWAERAAEVVRAVPWAAKPFERYALYMQVRTRAIDDVLLDFVRAGGRQVVLLGAGFDARAVRFAEQLRSVTVFEVDHPATQRRKRALLEDARVHYLSFDFESMSALAGQLAALGHDRSQRTLSIWEGVTMYLTEEAIDATLAAVRDYGAAGSWLAFTYFDRRRMLERPRWRQRLARRFVSSIGEPFRFGWNEGEVGPWLAARGFELLWNKSERELADGFLPPPLADRVEAAGRYVALAARL